MLFQLSRGLSRGLSLPLSLGGKPALLLPLCKPFPPTTAATAALYSTGAAAERTISSDMAQPEQAPSFAETIGLIPQRVTTAFAGLPLSLRDRPRPASPSFYTGVQNSTYHDFMLLIQRKLNEMKAKMAATELEVFAVPPENYPTWITKEDLQERLDCKLRTTQYRAIISGLNEIYSQPNAEGAKDFLDKFRRTVLVKEREVKVPERDAWGRMLGIGRRKDSVARVFLVEGDGEMLVNGKQLYEYFPHINLRETAIAPLALVNKLGVYNVWVLTNGGGFTGQAEAIRLGMSRALEHLDPSLRPTLKKEGFLTRDSRVVEPKKPGRKKARKLKQWVKR